MKNLFITLSLIITINAFSYDSTKLHIRLKIMDPTMVPSTNYPNAVTSSNSQFNTWLSQHKVTRLEKVFSSEYDNVGELKYKYKMYHDTDAYVLQAALDSIDGLEEVFVYNPRLYCNDPVGTNDPFTEPHMNSSENYTKWHLDMVDAECAWSITTGNPKVLIGIIDTYMDIFHEDMRGKFKIWRHPNFDFSSIASDSFDVNDSNLPYFNHRNFYHGMKVSGAIATGFNNNTGIVSIGGNCKLAGYSYFGFWGLDGSKDLDEAVMMAIEDSVKVINCSWTAKPYLYDDLINYGISKGVVFTMSGGNEPGHNINEFFLNEGALIVGGTNKDNMHGPLHYNNGRYIDLCAPTEFISTKIQNHPYYPGQSRHYQWHWYQGFSGTSASAPFVAGIVGLMFSANPYLSPAAIECLLKAGCDTIADGASFPDSLGAGRVNAYNSVWLAKGESGSKYGSHTWNELRHIASDITLESGCTLTISHNILISPYRKIIVKPGAKLIVDGAILTNLCGDGPWGGIVVLGDSSKSQIPEYNQGVVELKNGAIIENAINGVRAIGWNTNGTINPRTTGGIIKAINSTFRNNTMDVVIWGKTISSLGKTQANVSYLKKCNFYTTDDIKISSLKEHINLTWCNNINMQGLKFYDQRTGVNPKTQGRIGINSAEASFNLFAFNNGVDTITPNRFVNLKQAIKAVSVPADSRTLITKCTTNSYKGFYVYKNPFARAIDNQFTIKDDQYISEVTNYPYGLYIDGTSFFDLEANTCNGSQSNPTKKGGHAGLMIRNSGANNNTFYHNTFDNLTVASEAVGANKDGNDKLIGLKFRCNNYSNGIKDLQILVDPVLNATGTSGMAEIQGSLNLPADNLFGNPSAVLRLNIENMPYTFTYFHQDENVGTVNTRTKPLRKINVLLTNTSLIIPQCPDNLTKSGTGWPAEKRGDLALYKNVLIPVNTAWKAAIDHGNSPTNVVNDIETATSLNYTLIYDQLMSYSPWLSMEALGKLAAKESVFSNTQIRNVLVANPQAGRSGWIQSILNSRIGLLAPSDMDDIMAAGDSLTNRDTMAWEVAEINTNYDLLLNDLVGWYLDDTLDHLQTLDTLLTHPYNPMYRYQLAGLYFERNLYENYQSVLDSIPAQIDLTDKEADYLQTFTDLYYRIKLWKQDSVPLPILDSSQLVWLNNFYDEHPIMPGIGHALLAINDTAYRTTDPVYITDTTAYEGGEPFRTTKIIEEKVGKLLKVYPNPTNKIVTLEWLNTSKINLTLKVKIIDQNGKLVIEKEWAKNQKTIMIDLGNQEAGIYYCYLIGEGKILEAHNILLTK